MSALSIVPQLALPAFSAIVTLLIEVCMKKELTAKMI